MPADQIMPVTSRMELDKGDVYVLVYSRFPVAYYLIGLSTILSIFRVHAGTEEQIIQIPRAHPEQVYGSIMWAIAKWIRGWHRLLHNVACNCWNGKQARKPQANGQRHVQVIHCDLFLSFLIITTPSAMCLIFLPLLPYFALFYSLSRAVKDTYRYTRLSLLDEPPQSVASVTVVQAGPRRFYRCASTYRGRMDLSKTCTHAAGKLPMFRVATTETYIKRPEKGEGYRRGIPGPYLFACQLQFRWL